jgi:Immunoglobulin I-set domain
MLKTLFVYLMLNFKRFHKFHSRLFAFFHSGTLIVLWRRGTNVLTASTLKVTTDERIKLVNGYNLEISELEPQDAGDYVCQISDKVNRDQTHTVEILGKFCSVSVVFLSFRRRRGNTK